MALFQSDLKETVRRLSNKDFASAEERDELLGRLATAEGLRAKDLVWMLFRPDRALRDASVKLLGQIADPSQVAALQREFLSVHEVLRRGGADRAAAAILDYVNATGRAFQ